MKFIKSISLIIILGILLFISRDFLFSHLVKYEITSTGLSNKKIEPNLKKYIAVSATELESGDIAEIVELALKLTSEKLKFTTRQRSNNPNDLFVTGKAHCVGYAIFYSSVCNELLFREGLNNQWTTKPYVGKIHFLNLNVHKIFNSDFLKDHDFVIVENLKTGEQITIDPVLYDYLKIRRIELK